MGWCSEDGRHEGYLVGWLGSSDGEQPVRIVQAVCGCGWRSPRIFAPFGTVSLPGALVCLPSELAGERFEDAVHDLWVEHVGKHHPSGRITWAL